ncbi:transcription elongation factor GreA [Desulforhabdus amnigena]|jgi:transcription elongation factor GreA|uniref:Transcription elongation factor GreA n=1 Tax=Desulforhabdus amnigena TaxID=40218 RepID=A0A9W6FWP6_9BACT|nr:transcription elongation factor GreA [Desulforhabdus amnigena]GLI36234.1 transcription elongation factor GreA [Desulforhabdus amnigena]
MQRVPITKDGYERLKIELQRLQKEERPAVIKAIEEARGHGDLSENAEYEAAKEKQSLIEGRIQDLCEKLGHCEIIEGAESENGRAIFGSKVVMEDLETGEVTTYTLVGPYEADVQAGTISVTSPLGKALIGKEEGDEVRVQTPKGIRNLEILEVQN